MASEPVTAIVELALAEAPQGPKVETMGSETTKLMDYLVNQGSGPLAAFPDSAEAQARLLADPSGLAGKLGEYAERFQERTEAVTAMYEEGVALDSKGLAKPAEGVLGPASALPRPQAQAGAEDGELLDSVAAMDGLVDEVQRSAMLLSAYNLEIAIVNHTVTGVTGGFQALLRG